MMRNIFCTFIITFGICFLAFSQDFSVSTACGSGSVDFAATGGTPTLWSFGNGNTSAMATPTNVYANPGNYTVSLTLSGPAAIVSKTIFVPAKPVFSYGREKVCMSSEISNSIFGISPVEGFSALNGAYVLPPGMPTDNFNPNTGLITFSVENIGSGTYPITYTYAVAGCSSISTSFTTMLGIGNASPGPFSSFQDPLKCNQLVLTRTVGTPKPAKGFGTWKISNINTGNVFVDLPSPDQFGRSKHSEPYVTPVLTVTSILKLSLYDLYCEDIVNGENDQLWTIAGLTKPGTVTSNINTVCQNYFPVLTLSGYLGSVNWEYASASSPFSTSNGSNAIVAQIKPGAVGVTFNTVHTPSTSVINTTGNFFFRARVNYTQYGNLGNCETLYSNVVTINSVFCTVTSAIVNTTTSICLNQASVPGVFFNSNSTLTGSVASITGYAWSFGSGNTASSWTATLRSPVVRYNSASVPTKAISLTVTGTGFQFITNTTIQVDDYSNQSGISLPASNTTICSGNFVTLRVNTSNNSPVFQWQSSALGLIYTNVTTVGLGENTANYTTPGLLNTNHYRATVRNGVCPIVTTTGRRIFVIQPLTINPAFDQPSKTICEGNNVTITAIGLNGSINFLSTSPGNAFNTVTATGLGGGQFQTGYFEAIGGYYIQAQIANPFSGCSPALSGIYTVSVVSCPVLANFTSSGALFNNQACINNSNFIFTDITPTISGVKFVQWDWDFGSASNRTPLTTTVGNRVSSGYNSEGFQTVNLRITAVAGVKTYTGLSSSVVVSVDGLSNMSSITGIPNPICENTFSTLSINSTNLNPAIQWELSFAGWNAIANATTTSFVTPNLSTTTGYRAVVTNGVCPSAAATINIIVELSPQVSILSAEVLTVCSGGRQTFSLSGANYTSIEWLEAPLPIFAAFNPVAGGTGTNSLIYKTDFLPTGTYYYIAKLNGNTCAPAYSGIITVTSGACPIQPVISVTSAYFPQRTCNDSPSFTFKDITNTISGIKFVRWAWSFDTESNNPFQTTTSGSGTIPIIYSIATPFTQSTKEINLTITGVSGNNTFTGVSTLVVTIDGIPAISGFTSSAVNVCSGNVGTNVFFTSSNPVASVGAIKWQQSTIAGGGFEEFTATSASFHTTGPLFATTYYRATATNGICPVFTTPSLPISYFEQSEITVFTYTGQFCESQITPELPALFRTGNTIPGIYFVSSANSGQLSVNPSTGSFIPQASSLNNNIEIFNITYSIPGAGAVCAARSQTRQIAIGRKFSTPLFFYNSAPYCSTQGFVSRVINSGEGIPGAYYFSNSINVNSITGTIDLSIVTVSGVYDATFVIPSQAGCSTVIGNATLTVTSAPTEFSFAYGKPQYCSDEGIVVLASAINIDDPLGFWTLIKNNPSSEITVSTVGSIYLTSLTSTDFYTVTYTKPARGGCFNKLAKSQFIFVTQLPKMPIFNYGSPAEFCSSSNIPLPTVVSNVVNGSYFTDDADILVNGSSGKVLVPINTISGLRNIKYAIPPAGACVINVVGTAQINFIKTYEPIFSYDRKQICNNVQFELMPIDTFDIGMGTGQFYSNTPGLQLNSITGVITVTSATPQKNYAINYKRPKPAVCGIGDEVTKIAASIFIEGVPPNPSFSYGNDPICSNASITPKTITGRLNAIFAAPDGFSVNPNTGELFPSNLSDGEYVITVTNRSLLPGSVSTITCPLISGFAVVTVGSNVSLPPFNYGIDKFCSTDFIPKNIVGITLTGGYFSGTAGLLLNTLTGTITISGSSASGFSTPYSVSYRIDRTNGCPPLISSTGITVYRKQTQPSFAYARPEYCKDEVNPFPISSSTLVDGLFSAPSDISVNSITGEIGLANSSARAGVLIEYRLPANPGCPSISTVTSISITKPDEPQLSYGNAGICVTNQDPYPFVVIPSNGTFSGSFGLKVLPDSGRIVLFQSPIGVFQVSYTSPDKGVCKGRTVTENITITSPVTRPQFKYIGSPFCTEGTALPVGSFQYGVFRASTNIAFITSVSGLTLKDTIAGEIDLKNSIPGEQYTISYVVPAIGGCEPITVQDTLSIRKGSVGQIASDGEKGVICGGAGIKIEISNFKGNISWEQRNFKDTTWRDAVGDFADRVFVSGALTDTTYFRAKVNYGNCPDSVYSSQIKVKVIQGSFGGTALSNENTNFKVICNDLETTLSLRENVGGIVWQFSKDSLNWDDVGVRDTLSQFTTPSQNEYGLKIWYRAQVTNETCPADYSNRVLVKVCDKLDFIPNALTPGSDDNGDQTQSTWVLKQLNLRDFAEVRIFNRYGSEVYFANGRQVTERPWDGGGLPAGTYYYVIDRKDQTKVLTGSVSIIK